MSNISHYNETGFHLIFSQIIVRKLNITLHCYVYIKFCHGGGSRPNFESVK